MSSSSSSIAHERAARLVGHLQPNATAALGTTPRKFIKQEVRGRVGLIWLNRPSALNALNDELMGEVGAALAEYEASGVIGCVVITGEGKAFAAGADIKEMVDKTFHAMVYHDKIAPWEKVSQCKIPIIAAVNGYAFGGGCEVAMMCDIILASDNAKFGQPEIKIGTIPGAGGTQRLTKAIGKSRAMEMVLTGNPVTAAEMASAGLVSRVYPLAELLPAALKMADQIASLSLPIVKMAKASLLASFNTTLTTGMSVERAHFQSTFALEDQKIGMEAFIAKKSPQWKHQ